MHVPSQTFDGYSNGNSECLCFVYEQVILALSSHSYKAFEIFPS
jgi:hypothetical protein